MKKISCSLLFAVLFLVSTNRVQAKLNPVPLHDSIPALFKGVFSDDYGIRYRISDSTWEQLPGIKYHILKWDTAKKYIIARNGLDNPSEKGLYTRIDYMLFENMAPYQWGFCLTVYNAVSDTAAEANVAADREHPRKGCNGYPFSRMKRADP